MLGAAAAGAGAAVSLVAGAEPASAADGNPVLIGESNTAKATTSVTTKKGNGIEGSTSDTAGSGVYGVNTSTGGQYSYGVYGTSQYGAGVYGACVDGAGVLGFINGATFDQAAVHGIDESTGEGGGNGVWGSSLNGTGVLGTGSDFGVIGSSTHGKGVFGESTYGFGVYATTASGVGVAGSSDSTTGVSGTSIESYGVSGTSTNGTGVYGTITGDTSGQSAVEGVDQSTGNGGGAGVTGTSTNGTGVIGTSTKGTGVTGTTSSDAASGVAGVNNASSSGGNGVYGSSTNGSGVYGISTNGYGVYAQSTNSDALYVDGNAKVTGTLSKGGGSFQIDHPLDPAHKYLYHSFVESPDMMNVYNGTVTLDDDGGANVTLPDWFEALNRDYRYQLTPIGAPTVVYISEEIVDGNFGIAGGNAGQKVSWQVTGVRQDAWANANRIPVEVDKPVEEQGRYLHPELFEGGYDHPVTATTLSRHRHRRPGMTSPAVFP
jgi:hypothetical protein